MAQSRQKITVEVESRTQTGKNANRRLRASGQVPGNVYGLNVKPFAVSMNPRKVESLLHSETGRNTIFAVTMVDSQERRDVMIRELQRDPVTEQLVHVDLLRVDPTKKIKFDVPIRLIGTPTGVKNEGGILEFMLRTAEVLCLPSGIPEHLDVDVSDLHMGQHVLVKDLEVGDEFEILDDPESMIASVAAPRAEIEEEPVEEGVEEAGAEATKEDEAGSEAKEKGD